MKNVHMLQDRSAVCEFHSSVIIDLYQFCGALGNCYFKSIWSNYKVQDSLAYFICVLWDGCTDIQ